ncbi:hypothetical protein T261_1922 [Streptomyces lydicus]|nr:hypothetical protein T261_1922 [Streptomyces lydicus]
MLGERVRGCAVVRSRDSAECSKRIEWWGRGGVPRVTYPRTHNELAGRGGDMASPVRRRPPGAGTDPRMNGRRTTGNDKENGTAQDRRRLWP